METQAELSANTLQYHASAVDWASDLDFFKVETVFFHRLLDDYFIRLSAPEYVLKLRDIERELLDLEDDRYELDKLLAEHFKKIELSAMDPAAEKTENQQVMHIRIGYLMTELMHKFRHTKKTLFALVEEVVKDNALFKI
ncbi:hypothetical protein [Pedobacter panaciterrae]